MFSSAMFTHTPRSDVSVCQSHLSHTGSRHPCVPRPTLLHFFYLFSVLNQKNPQNQTALLIDAVLRSIEQENRVLGRVLVPAGGGGEPLLAAARGALASPSSLNALAS